MNHPMRADTTAFVESLPTLEVDGESFLDPDRETVVARAPGRLDVMGGIADYSGSLVLQLPLAEATFVAVQARDERVIEIASFGAEGAAPRHLRADVGGCLAEPGRAVERTRSRFGERDAAWAGYVLGGLAMLVDRRGLVLDGGARVAIRSDVPEGKGVSSSAALEVSAMSALATRYGVELAPVELARLCQRVEHEVVGAPCGIMDQMAVTLGREGHLLALRCQPAEVVGHVPLPPDVAVWGIDSGVRHRVAGEDYVSVRTAAFMGYRILAGVLKLDARDAGPGRVEIDDPHWRGYLANVTPLELDNDLLPVLPLSMRGEDFLERFGGTTDSVTTIDPDRRYRIRSAACHAIRESSRIGGFAAELGEEPTDERMRKLGAWMGMSHSGYGDCGLGCDATDRIVDLVRERGAGHGLFGARITGGGSGGTVAVLGRPEADDLVREIAATLRRETGSGGYVFAGSSPGVDVRRIRPGGARATAR